MRIAPIEPAKHETAELLSRYQAGSEDAADELFDRYVARLVALARSRLDRRTAARIDADDVVQSAYRSFFLRARQGQFELRRSGDLWRLLAKITLRKLYRQVGRHRADRRSVDREEGAGDSDPTHPPVENIASGDPTPEQAAVLTDEIAAIMAQLTAFEQRVLELRLQDCTIEEIASELQRGERTVRRTLEAIRQQVSAIHDRQIHE